MRLVFEEIFDLGAGGRGGMEVVHFGVGVGDISNILYVSQLFPRTMVQKAIL